MLRKFSKNDIFHNQIKTYPNIEFLINNGTVYYNQNINKPGVSNGAINLYESSASIGKQFITKGGTLSTFRTISKNEFSQFSYGDELTGSSNREASISSNFYSTNDRTQITTLKNTLNYYGPCSPHFCFNGQFGDKSSQDLRLLDIPTIFYGSSIEKGSLSLKFYLTGTLIGELQDTKQNGELVEVSGLNTGSVAGVVLYREGFILLTGSWDLHDSYLDNFPALTTSSIAPAWKYFGTTGSSGPDLVPSSSFDLSFRGTNRIPVLTMLCHADKGELNHSNNPTYISHGQEDKMIPDSSSFEYVERDDIEIKNLVKSDFIEEEPKFEKVTYISKVALYDEERNLIGIAKVATPVRKRESDQYTFKLKIDF